MWYRMDWGGRLIWLDHSLTFKTLLSDSLHDFGCGYDLMTILEKTTECKKETCFFIHPI